MLLPLAAVTCTGIRFWHYQLTILLPSIESKVICAAQRVFVQNLDLIKVYICPSRQAESFGRE
jgi:hypothetical protein